MTDATSTSPSDDPQQPSRDKRWLGLALCVGSSLAVLAIVALLASEIVFFVEGDTFAKDTEDLENFSTSAGSSEKN